MKKQRPTTRKPAPRYSPKPTRVSSRGKRTLLKSTTLAVDDDPDTPSPSPDPDTPSPSPDPDIPPGNLLLASVRRGAPTKAVKKQTKSRPVKRRSR